MEKCTYCGAATILRVNEIPTCVECDDNPERRMVARIPHNPPPASESDDQGYVIRRGLSRPLTSDQLTLAAFALLSPAGSYRKTFI
jgi:hypothetical protein